MTHKISRWTIVLMFAILLPCLCLSGGAAPGKKGAAAKSKDKSSPRKQCSLDTFSLSKNPDLLPDALKRKHCPGSCGKDSWRGTAGDIDCDGKLEFSICEVADMKDRRLNYYEEYFVCTLYDDASKGFKTIPNKMESGCSFSIQPEQHGGYHDLRSSKEKCDNTTIGYCRRVNCLYRWNGKQYVEKSCEN